MTYAISSNSKKIIQKSVLQYLRLYHSQYFPLLEKNKIYKQVSDNLILLRVGKYSSPGDILGYLTQKLSLSQRDMFYCIPIDEKLSDRISEKTENKLNYIYDRSLNKIDDIDINYLTLEYKITSSIYYLAHYLYMLENKTESSKSNKKEYILIDNNSQWQSEKRYEDEYSIDKYNRRKRNQKLVYTRFNYSDFIEDAEFQNFPLIKVSKILGFNIKFRIENMLYDTIDEKMFNNKFKLVDLIFIGDSNWKEKLKIDLDLNFYNKMIENTLGGEEMMIYEKPNWYTLN